MGSEECEIAGNGVFSIGGRENKMSSYGTGGTEFDTVSVTALEW